jgi:hypothetical protein
MLVCTGVIFEDKKINPSMCIRCALQIPNKKPKRAVQIKSPNARSQLFPLRTLPFPSASTPLSFPQAIPMASRITKLLNHQHRLALATAARQAPRGPSASALAKVTQLRGLVLNPSSKPSGCSTECRGATLRLPVTFKDDRFC